MNMEVDKTKPMGPQTLQLVKLWLESGLRSIQPPCYKKLIEDNFESPQDEMDARLDAIACVGLEKILKVVEVTNEIIEQESSKTLKTKLRLVQEG